MSEPWFDPNSFGALYGGIGGGGIGILGGVIGTLAGLLAPWGKGRSLVLGLMGVMAALGLCSLGFGLTALACAQPYAIWYPALLLGVIATGVGGGLMPIVRKHYQQVEQLQQKTTAPRKT